MKPKVIEIKTLLKILIVFFLSLIHFCVLAQGSISVSGVVRDGSGVPLVGVAVQEKGSSKGVTTDSDGQYVIRTRGDATLIYSSIGYKTIEILVGNRSSIDVVMEDDAQIIEQAVAIGYGSQSKLTLTGSVAQTSGNELVKSSSVNLSQGLAGRLSGIIVNNRSGEPGADDAIMFIRGRSTLGNNSPLIIIDGIPGRGDELSRLTGEEIESINVLKDASAAIYGSRSANGVILVTTKRGRYKEAPKITFTYDLGLQQPTRIVKMADAVLYANAYNDELAITGGAPYYNETQIKHYIDQDDPIRYPNTDWFAEIIKPLSSQHKYGVSIDGGGDRVAYFVQMNGQYQDGVYKKSATNYSQYNVRSNIDIKVNKYLKLGFDLNARQQRKNYSAFPSDQYGIFYITTRMKPTGAAYFPNGYIRGGTNPVVLVQDLTGYDRSTINTVNTTLNLNLDLDFLVKGLNVNGKIAYDVVGKFSKNWKKNWSYYTFDEITELFEERKSSYWSTPVLSEKQSNYHTVTMNANINYDRTFKGHHITALAGLEQSSYRLDHFKAGINSYDSDIIDELFAGSADKSWYEINGHAKETARRSFFGRLGYNFNSKYMLQFIIRADGSENFPSHNRWGIFPGASLGWRLSEEPFIKNRISCLTNLKLRASYGEQGNDQVAPFQYLTTYIYPKDPAGVYKMKIDDKDVNFIISETIPNNNITWEVARSFNVGIDGSINNGIFSWEVEGFYMKRSNILCRRNASIPYYSGLTDNLPDENIGIVSNRGFELQIGHQNKIRNFLYRINGNFMWVKNTIDFMDETPWGKGYEYMNLTGRPMGSTLIYQVKGINKTAQDLANNPQMSGATLGDFIFEDLDKNGKIDNKDRKRCELTEIPQIVFGLNFDGSWKNFDFTLLLQGQARVRFYYAPLTDPVSGNVERFAAEKAWSLNNTDSDYPRLGSNISNGGVTRSSFYYRNAAFLRIKNLEIGYTLRNKYLDPSFPIKSLRFYIAGYNLLTFSGLKNVDPETGDEAYQNYPQVRIFNAGMKLTF